MKKLNMAIAPKEMLLAAINTQNNISLTENDVNIKQPQVIEGATEEDATLDGVPVKITRNTSVDIDVLSDEVKDDFVTFKYQRVSLSKLFSQCDPMIREVDVKKEGTVSVGDVVSEILRKYKVLTSDADFDFTITQNQIALIAKPTNLAFIDRVNFTVEQSLLSRISLVELDGFKLPTGDDIIPPPKPTPDPDTKPKPDVDPEHKPGVETTFAFTGCKPNSFLSQREPNIGTVTGSWAGDGKGVVAEFSCFGNTITLMGYAVKPAHGAMAGHGSMYLGTAKNIIVKVGDLAPFPMEWNAAFEQYKTTSANDAVTWFGKLPASRDAKFEIIVSDGDILAGGDDQKPTLDLKALDGSGFTMDAVKLPIDMHILNRDSYVPMVTGIAEDNVHFQSVMGKQVQSVTATLEGNPYHYVDGDFVLGGEYLSRTSGSVYHIEPGQSGYDLAPITIKSEFPLPNGVHYTRQIAINGKAGKITDKALVTNDLSSIVVISNNEYEQKEFKLDMLTVQDRGKFSGCEFFSTIAGDNNATTFAIQRDGNNARVYWFLSDLAVHAVSQTILSSSEIVGIAAQTSNTAMVVNKEGHLFQVNTQDQSFKQVGKLPTGVTPADITFHRRSNSTLVACEECLAVVNEQYATTLYSFGDSKPDMWRVMSVYGGNGAGFTSTSKDGKSLMQLGDFSMS